MYYVTRCTISEAGMLITHEEEMNLKVPRDAGFK